MQSERRAVEHQLVLSTDLIGVDDRNAALGRTGNDDILPNLVLVA